MSALRQRIAAAAKRGDISSKFLVACDLLAGGHNSEAADALNNICFFAPAAYVLSDMYRDGKGVRQDKQRAEELLVEASFHGLAAAIFGVGCAFAKKELSAKDRAAQVAAVIEKVQSDWLERAETDEWSHEETFYKAYSDLQANRPTEEHGTRLFFTQYHLWWHAFLRATDCAKPATPAAARKATSAAARKATPAAARKATPAAAKKKKAAASKKEGSAA